MEDWSTATRWRKGVAYASGLGALAGAGEALWWVLRAPLTWTLTDGALLAGAGVLGMAVVATLTALVLGPLHTLRRDAPVHRTLALQFGLVAGVLLALYLWPWALDLHREGRAGVAAMMAMLPVGSVGVVHLNARFWLARAAMGKAPKVGWTAGSWGGAAIAALVVLAVAATSGNVGAYALPDDPSMVVITIDGLSADAADLGDASSALPALRELASQGARFTQMVAPSTSTVGNAGALWTGLHPLRHRAIDDMRALSRALPTIPERLSEEGFATVAFASSAVVQGVGLDQGFHTFDADPSPGHIAQLRWVQALLPTTWLRRSNAQTVAAYRAWSHAHGTTPHLVWLALSLEPGGLAALDADLAAALAVVTELGRPDTTLIAVLGTHGVTPGDRRAGLSDALVHVPFVLKAPGYDLPVVVDKQVRMVDVPLTLLAFASLEHQDESEGLDMLGFADGRRAVSLWTSLVGHNEGGQPMAGLRHQGIKYVVDPEVEEEDLFNLEEDPGETHDLTLEQPETAAKARGLLEPELSALQRVSALPTLGATRRARLDALETP